MGSRASKPPVLGATATQVKAWFDALVIQGGLLLSDGDTDGRDGALYRACIAESLRLYAADLVRHHVVTAQELGASNESVAWALGVRPSTALTRYPNRKAAAGVRARKAGHDGTGERQEGLSGAAG